MRFAHKVGSVKRLLALLDERKAVECAAIVDGVLTPVSFAKVEDGYLFASCGEIQKLDETGIYALNEMGLISQRLWLLDAAEDRAAA